MNINKIRISVFSAIIIGVLSGCSSTDDSLNYRASVITPTLEVPPDLVTPASDKNLELPGSKVGKPENAGRFKDTGNLNTATTQTLPKIEGISIHHDAGVYWVTVDRPVDKVYPKVKSFWADQGFRLIKDEPLLGIQETEWLSVKSGNDSFFSSLLASLRAAESRDQYITRIERDGDERSRIYIAHRGQELVIDESTDNLDQANLKQGWQFVPTDSTKEVEMLSRLMIFLGLKAEHAQQQVAALGSLQPRSKLALDSDDQPYVVVQGGLRQTLNRLHYRLDKLAIAFTDQSVGSDEAIVTIDSQALADLDVLETIDQSAVGIRLKSSVNSNTTRIDVLGKSGSSVHDKNAVNLMNFLVEQLK